MRINGNGRKWFRYSGQVKGDRIGIFLVMDQVPAVGCPESQYHRLFHPECPHFLQEALFEEFRVGLDLVFDVHRTRGIGPGASVVRRWKQVSPYVGHPAGQGRVPESPACQLRAVILVGPLVQVPQPEAVLLERRLIRVVVQGFQVAVVKGAEGAGAPRVLFHRTLPGHL